MDRSQGRGPWEQEPLSQAPYRVGETGLGRRVSAWIPPSLHLVDSPAVSLAIPGSSQYCSAPIFEDLKQPSLLAYYYSYFAERQTEALQLLKVTTEKQRSRLRPSCSKTLRWYTELLPPQKSSKNCTKEKRFVKIIINSCPIHELQKQNLNGTAWVLKKLSPKSLTCFHFIVSLLFILCLSFF